MNPSIIGGMLVAMGLFSKNSKHSFDNKADQKNDYADTDHEKDCIEQKCDHDIVSFDMNSMSR